MFGLGLEYKTGHWWLKEQSQTAKSHRIRNGMYYPCCKAKPYADMWSGSNHAVSVDAGRGWTLEGEWRVAVLSEWWITAPPSSQWCATPSILEDASLARSSSRGSWAHLAGAGIKKATKCSHSTRLHDKPIPRLRESCEQVEAEVVSNSKNKTHQTWDQSYNGALYK